MQEGLLMHLDSVMEKLDPPERTKLLLLVKAKKQYGDQGLEIAEDLMDERSPRHPDFTEEKFWEELRGRLNVDVSSKSIAVKESRTTMTTTKSAMLTVKLTPSRLEEFRISAILRGTTMSALITQFIATVVREEMQAVPEAFKRRGSYVGPDDLMDLIHPDHTN